VATKLTVCIAALCDNATKVVIAADRMLTGSDVEFEQDIRKFEPITSGCVALSAGSALEKVDLIRSCRVEVSTARSPTISDIVSSIKNCYVALRVQRAEELHLKPIGLTLNEFLRAQGQLAPDVVLRQTHSIENERLGVSLLIAEYATKNIVLSLQREARCRNSAWSRGPVYRPCVCRHAGTPRCVGG
jgi:hypothetical protein